MKEKILFALRVAAGAVFVYSGYVKLLEPHQNFLAVIYSYKIVTGPPAQAAARILPWAELVAGLFVLKGLWIRFSSGVLLFLNTLFAAAVAQALVRRLPIEDCGCFGEAAFHLRLHQVLILDMALWLALVYLLMHANEAGWWSLDRLFHEKK